MGFPVWRRVDKGEAPIHKPLLVCGGVGHLEGAVACLWPSGAWMISTADGFEEIATPVYWQYFAGPKNVQKAIKEGRETL